MLSEYLYQLRDTLILSGVDRRFADLLLNPDAIDAPEVEELQRYNGNLLNATKQKLLDVNRITVVPVGG